MRTIVLFVICVLVAPYCLSSPQGNSVERIINVAVNTNLPPYQFMDGERLEGVHVALIERIAADRNFRIRYFPKRDDDECFTALTKGDVDVIIGVARNKVEDAKIAVSDILTSTSLCMVVRSDLLKRNQQEKRPFPRSAAVEFGSTPYTMITNLGITHYQVLGNQLRVFEALVDGSVDAAVSLKDSILFQISQAPGRNRFTILHNYLGYASYVAAVRVGDRELLRTLNDGISRIRAGQEYETILNRWLVAEDNPKAWRALRWLGIAFALALAVSAIYLYLSLRIRAAMKRRVEEQTREIQEASQKLERQLLQIKYENDLRNSIIKYSPSAMVLAGTDHRVNLMNRSARVLTGTRGNFEGMDVRKLTVFGDAVRHAGPGLFEPGITAENIRLRLGAKSYRYTMHQVFMDGTPNGLLIMVQDVTKEDREIQVEFEKDKHRTLTRLVAGIAHEIRNPLMSIRTFAAVIDSRGHDLEVQQSFAKYVPAEVDRINRLIENMINYSKPAVRQVRKCAVGDMILECVGLVSPSIRSSRIALSTDIGDGLFISADRDQVKQVLINLLINGIEAIEKKLASSKDADVLNLIVKARGVSGSVVIEVHDEGAGMSDRERADCLNPFFTTKAAGTGLGLTLCAQYLAENAARLDMSTEEGRYTTMTMTFPRSSSESPNPDNR